MRIDWSDTALAQLRAEANWIALDRPLIALEWADRVEHTVARLREFPMSGRGLPEFPRLPFREVLVGDYRFIYLVAPGRVLVALVKHSRQKLRLRDLRPHLPPAARDQTP